MRRDAQPIRILSWNVNGIRSIHRKGFVPWLQAEAPDVLGLQETRATEDDVAAELRHAALEPAGFRAYYRSA